MINQLLVIMNFTILASPNINDVAFFLAVMRIFQRIPSLERMLGLSILFILPMTEHPNPLVSK